MYVIVQHGIKFGAFASVDRAKQWAHSNLSESYEVERIC